MTFLEFQHLARLHVVGALDEEEEIVFAASRNLFGRPAEECLRECQRLGAAMALSLHPAAPRRGAKAQLLSLIRGGGPDRSPAEEIRFARDEE